jgi:hypothetical protein
VNEAVHSWLGEQPKSFFSAGIQKLVERYNKCIVLHGDYVDKRHVTLLTVTSINSLNTDLNPIYHLLALLGAHPILHVSEIRVKAVIKWFLPLLFYSP